MKGMRYNFNSIINASAIIKDMNRVEQLNEDLLKTLYDFLKKGHLATTSSNKLLNSISRN